MVNNHSYVNDLLSPEEILGDSEIPKLEKFRFSFVHLYFNYL